MQLRIFALGAIVVLVVAGAGVRELSQVGIQQGYSPVQPIAFPHSVHAGKNKIPCLYCHYAARSSRHAGIPPASICMNCHKLLEKQTVEIEKLREAVQMQRPIKWIKIHNLPDFVYFNHSQHVLSGVQCQRCHGPIEQMDRVKQAAPLTMGWCLDCHRDRSGQAASTVRRVVINASRQTTPASSLDCGSCHH